MNMNYLNKIDLNYPLVKKNSSLKTPSLSFKSDTPNIDFKDFIFNPGYLVSFRGNKDNYTANEREFIKFRDAFSVDFREAQTKYRAAYWNFLINATDENENVAKKLDDDRSNLYTDKQKLVQLINFRDKGVNDPTLQRHLKDLINKFENNITYEKELKEIAYKEKAIGKKSTNYVFNVRDKNYSYYEILELLAKEKDVQLRKEAYDTMAAKGDYLKDDTIELVKMRNNFAQKKGYANYFEYMMKEVYELDIKQLDKLLDDLARKTNDLHTRIFNEDSKKLAEVFNIKPEDLRPWHYDYLLDDDPERLIDNYIKSPEQLVALSSKMFKEMGFDPEDKRITSDLYPREKKYQNVMALDVEASKDVRVLANVINSIHSFNALNHERGHCHYTANISNNIPYVDKTETSDAAAEGIAKLFEDLPYRENKILCDGLNIPEKILTKIDIKRKKVQLLYMRSLLRYIEFDRKMYENPDQNLAKLWFDMTKKYQNKNVPEELTNYWASVQHFVTWPCSFQYYLRANIMAPQIYKALATEKDQNNTTTFKPLANNTKVAEKLINTIFKPGKSKTEDELLTDLTGSPLNTNAFLEEINSLETL